MTTQEVANRYFELAKEGQNEKIISELYSHNIVSIEPENDSNVPIISEGLIAYKEKEKLFFELAEQVFGGFCKEPSVATFHFSCVMGIDVKMKGKDRKMKEEIGIFEVRDSKIVKEQWFYDDFN